MNSVRDFFIVMIIGLILPMLTHTGVTVFSGMHESGHFAFYAYEIVGIIAVVVSFLVSVPTIAAGFAFGGIIDVFIGYMVHSWGLSAGELFIFWLVLLAVLIALCYRFLRKQSK